MMKLSKSLTVAIACGYFAMGHNVARTTTENTPPVFVYKSSSMKQNLVFALSLTSDGNMSFHLSGPSSHSWVAIGTGDQMQGSMMFIAYSNGTQEGTTLSTRLGTGHNEPTYMSSPDSQVTASNQDGIYKVDAHYTNYTSWMPSQLDITSSSQQFIFALGPESHNSGDGSETAMTQRHETYGSFTMDLTRAVTSSGGVPELNGNNGAYTSTASSSAFDITSDHDWAGVVHAVVMCLAFVIIFPLGALLLRILSNVRTHYITQIVAFLLVVIGLGTGVYISIEYNSTKGYITAHQVIGLMVFAFVSIQMILGSVHHIIFKRKNRSTMLGKLHLFLGPIALILGIVNAPLGLNLAQQSRYNVPYAIVVAVVAALFIIVRGAVWYTGRQKRKTGYSAGFDVPLTTINS